MRVVFMGSPEPVIAPLTTLLEEGPGRGHELVGVVSQPARPVGRKGHLTDPPVARYAKEQALPVLQPNKASDFGFLNDLRRWLPDVVVTAAYGQILSEEFLAIPARATINIHPSMLPAYRGATPVPASLLAGDKTTGVTILFTVKELDAGPIILQKSVPIMDGETAGELTERLFTLSGPLLLDALDKLQDPGFLGVSQDEKRVTLCRKIHKDDGLIDWKAPSQAIVRRYRAYAPWPGSFSYLDGKRVQLTSLTQTPPDRIQRRLAPGEAFYDKTSKTLQIGTGEGQISIKRLKPAGGKEVDAASFWNGLRNRDQVTFISSSLAGPSL